MFCEDVRLTESCQSAKEGLLAIKKNHPDLVFLDVEMPWMNGFEMLEILDKDINFQIIFTTAYDQFAIKAFKVSAVDYLLKPIDSNDLVKAVEKAGRALQQKAYNANISNFIINTKAPAGQQRIAVPTKDGYDFIEVRRIVYCKASGAYTEVVLDNASRILLSKSLGEAESILPPELFERIHHSVLVNLQHINQYKKTNGSFIVMNNGDELTVSKSRKDYLLQRLGL